MPKTKRTPKPPARPGWGRAINFRLDAEVDEKLEAARRGMGLDRSSFCRMILSERLNADARMSA